MQTIAKAGKNVIKQTPLYTIYCKLYRDRQIYRNWVKAGKPIPPPHLIKEHVVKVYKKRFDLLAFIETGTFFGEMIEAVKKDFEKIYSIELGTALFLQAKER